MPLQWPCNLSAYAPTLRLSTLEMLQSVHAELLPVRVRSLGPPFPYGGRRAVRPKTPTGASRGKSRWHTPFHGAKIPIVHRTEKFPRMIFINTFSSISVRGGSTSRNREICPRRSRNYGPASGATARSHTPRRRGCSRRLGGRVRPSAKKTAFRAICRS